MSKIALAMFSICLGCNGITGINDYHVSAESDLGAQDDGPELLADSNEDRARLDSGGPDSGVPDVQDTLGSDDADGADERVDADDVPAVPVKRVFVSSDSYAATFGGLSGADAKCQALADTAKLGGSYKAWLSDSKVSASSRFTHPVVDYVLTDGTLVAKGWVGLTSGSLLHKINTTESGTASVLLCTWTHTTTTGASQPTAPCGDWAFATSAYGSGLGNIGYSDAMWTQWATLSCSYKCSFYCMEQ